MLRNTMTLLIAMFAMFAIVPCLAAEELSPELKVLDERVGTWKTETVIKPGIWVPQGSKSQGIETIEWTLGGKVLKGEAKFESTPGKGSNLHLMTYDPETSLYRMWYFDSFGAQPRGETSGRWDQETKTFTFTGTQPGGIKVSMTLRYVTNDRHIWHATWMDRNGDVMLEINGQLTRIPAGKNAAK